MNKFTKFFIWMMGLIGIAQTVWFVSLVVPIEYISPIMIKTVQTKTFWILITAVILGVIVGLISLVLILTAICAPKKSDQLRFKSSNGRLSISKTAVEKIIQNSILEEGHVNDVKVKLHLRTKNRVARVNVAAVDRLNQDLLKLGEEIQTIVTDKLEQGMDAKVKKVRVKVTPFDSSQNRQKASHPRVV